MTSPFRDRARSPGRSRPTSPRRALHGQPPSGCKQARGSNPAVPSWRRITSSESPRFGGGPAPQKDASTTVVHDSGRSDAPLQALQLMISQKGVSQNVDIQGPASERPVVPWLDLPVFVASFPSSKRADSDAGLPDHQSSESLVSMVPRVPELDLPVFKASFPLSKQVKTPLRPWDLQIDQRDGYRSETQEKLSEDRHHAGKKQRQIINQSLPVQRRDGDDTGRAGKSPSRTEQQAVVAAVACGLPASYGRETAKSRNPAMKVLQASRKQREYQDALLHQAQKQLMQAAKNEHENAMKDATKRVGGVEPANLNTAARQQQRLKLAEADLAQVLDAARGQQSPARGPPSPRTKQASAHGVHSQRTSAAARRQRSQSPWSLVKSRFDQDIASRDPADRPSPYPSSLLNSSVSSAGGSFSSTGGSFSGVVGSPSTPSLAPKSRSLNPRTRQQVWAGHSSPPISPRPEGGMEESVVDALMERNLLSSEARPWEQDPWGAPDDLAHVRAMFCAQVHDSCVLRVLRLENTNSAMCGVYEAVRGTTSAANERQLWHGTSFDCVRNIVLSGFNRAYCGRHGTKLGFGTYFSQSAEYSMRFCDRKQKRRVLILADVIVGSWTKGTADLVEPPHMDADCLSRYDSTVDDVDNPKIFCIFRDFQALPRYLVEFTMTPAEP